MSYFRRETESKEASHQAAQEEMQSNIQQIFALLGEKMSKPLTAENRLSNTSKMGSVWEVEDDYESDSDISNNRVLEFGRSLSESEI